MPVEIMRTSAKRKNLKARRVKGHQRLVINPEPCFKSPESILMDKIINNIKQEMKGKNKNEKKKETERGINSI